MGELIYVTNVVSHLTPCTVYYTQHTALTLSEKRSPSPVYLFKDLVRTAQ